MTSRSGGRTTPWMERTWQELDKAEASTAMETPQEMTENVEEAVATIEEASREIIAEVEKVIVGKRDAVRLALAAVLAGGHVLIEDIPGVGKTSLAKSLARALGCSFKRIQFTPDLLPSDITGISIYNQKTLEFEFRQGPVFANIVLADEINRGSPKTQSSLLECMEEAQVTADGMTYRLPKPFFVIATQNHIDMQGTYPLPEAQLDRFMMSISLGYPSAPDEKRILETRMGDNPMEEVRPVLDASRLLGLQKSLHSVHVDDAVQEWVVEIARATRKRQELYLGISPRGTLNLVYASRALAAMNGRTYVAPDDVKAVAVPVLAHRLVLKPEMRFRGMETLQIVEEALDSVPCPLTHAKR